MFHCHRVPLFVIQSLLCFLMYWLIRVLASHSAVSVVLILGCPRQLLLSLFIKHDHAPKCGAAWFIMKELNKSFICWILSRIVLWLVVCILPIPIKRFSNVVLILVVVWYYGCEWGSPVATDIVIWLLWKHNFIEVGPTINYGCVAGFLEAQFCYFLRGGTTEQCSHAPLFMWTVATFSTVSAGPGSVQS